MSVALCILAGCRAASLPAPPPSAHHYAHLFGQRYRTKIDLYLLESEETERVYLGRSPGDLSVIDRVPAGAELEIVSETHEVTEASGIRQKEGYPMGFICRLRYGGKDVAPVLVEHIQAGEHAPYRTPNQRLDETVVVRVH